MINKFIEIVQAQTIEKIQICNNRRNKIPKRNSL